MVNCVAPVRQAIESEPFFLQSDKQLTHSVNLSRNLVEIIVSEKQESVGKFGPFGGRAFNHLVEGYNATVAVVNKTAVRQDFGKTALVIRPVSEISVEYRLQIMVDKYLAEIEDEIFNHSFR